MKCTFAAFVAAFALFGCAEPARDGRGPVRAASPTPPPAVFADPARRTKLAAAYPKLDAYFASLHASQKLPGLAAGLVIDGDLAWSGGYGVTDLESKARIDADTLFEIGSITKPFTALAVLLLRDEGKLSLDAPASNYLAALGGVVYPQPDAAPITLRHLLTHTAGLPNLGPIRAGDEIVGDAALLAMLDGLRLQNVPGVTSAYSSLGLELAGAIVARVSGMPYRDFVRRRLLVPLGMTETDWWDRGSLPRERYATPYLLEEGGALTKTSPRPFGAFSPAGGLFASTRAMARYLAFQLDAWPPRGGPDAGPVKRSSRREMQTLQWLEEMAPGRANGVGLGWGVSYRCGVGPVFTMSGGGDGYTSMIVGYPDEGVALVLLANEFDPHLTTFAAFHPDDVIAILRATGGLAPRVAPPNPALIPAREHLTSLLFDHYEEAEAARLLAVPRQPVTPVPAGSRPSGLANVRKNFGSCKLARDLPPRDAMEAHWTMACERGVVEVWAEIGQLEPLVLDGLSWGIHLDDRYVGDPEPRVAGDARCAE